MDFSGTVFRVNEHCQRSNEPEKTRVAALFKLLASLESVDSEALRQRYNDGVQSVRMADITPEICNAQTDIDNLLTGVDQDLSDLVESAVDITARMAVPQS